MADSDWDITMILLVPVIDPLDLTTLSGSSTSTKSPAPSQTVTKGMYHLPRKG